jgi:hypothetical protein
LAATVERRLVLESWNKEPHILIGTRQGWKDPQPFGISAEDHRFHVYIIGKTGSGKTTLLRNLLIQHISLGHGVGLIDPHGDLAEDILDCIPASRTDDVVYFNPSDLEFPIAMNLLANVPKDERHLVASGVVAACKTIWHESWGPRLEYILYNAIAALLDCGNTSLLGVNRLLTDERYRDWVVRQVKDPFIRAFWENEYDNYDPRFQREAIAPIQNKLGQFLLNPVVRNILGQVKRKVDIRFTMDRERLFIANLAKGKLGHDKANLLGALLVSQFQLAAMARADTPEQERKDFFLFIDEFQNFSTESFASILSEARKYRLSLGLSHQFIQQLAPGIQQAVLGNVGTLVCFRIGHFDAEIMEKAFGKEFLAHQLVDLGRYEIAMQLCENGESRYPFQGTTLPPIDSIHGRREKIIARSRERFTTPRAKVTEKLERWISR